MTLAVLNSASNEVLPSQGQWATMLQMAEVLVKSGFLPKAIDTPAKATAVILKGRELGIPAMQSFAHINIIEGKPSCSAELQLALLGKGGITWEWKEQSNTAAEIIFHREGFAPFSARFDMEDAKRAGLLGKQNWQKYPGDMCAARAIAKGARKIGPDLIAGMSYTPEELGAEVDEEGTVIEGRQPVEPASKALNLPQTVKTPAGEVVDTSTGEITQQEPLSATGDDKIKEAAILLHLDWPDAETEQAVTQALTLGGDAGMAHLREYHRARFLSLCEQIRHMEPEVYPVEKAIQNARKKYLDGKVDDTLWKARTDLPMLKAYLSHMNERLDSLEGGESSSAATHEREDGEVRPR